MAKNMTYDYTSATIYEGFRERCPKGITTYEKEEAAGALYMKRSVRRDALFLLHLTVTSTRVEWERWERRK